MTAARLVLAIVMGAVAAMTWAGSEAPAQDPIAVRGQQLYADGCSDCHGTDLRGRAGRGPTLLGVGAAAVDFYVGTGRMPLSRPGIEPQRGKPIYGTADRAALIAYITSVGPGGPAIPAVDPSRGDLAEGRRLFIDNCSGCHQAMARGGIAPGLIAPPLDRASPKEIGEAIRVGPYLMPRFSERRLDGRQVNSIARYVTEVTQRPPDRGGWGIGNIGPIPEGLVAFLLAGGALVIVARIIGERVS